MNDESDDYFPNFLGLRSALTNLAEKMNLKVRDVETASDASKVESKRISL
jgi:hypothetical protein